MAWTGQQLEIMEAFNALLKACRLSGESGTEQLYYWLYDIVHELDGTIEESHDEGLCYDMNAAMAHELYSKVKTQQVVDRALGH